MPVYRLYHLDCDGCVRRSEWLEAAGDECAVAAAGRQDASAQCEVWRGRRLVTRLALHAEIPA